MHIKAHYLAILASGILLAGCDTVNDYIGLGEEQVDYKSTVRGEPLALPPDLSQSQIKPMYKAPETASASAYQEAMNNAKKEEAKGGVLTSVKGMQIKGSGDRRWLEVALDPNEVYPRLITFWGNEGFTISRDNPAAGIIETDWAENRAKIPGNFLRRIVGSIIDVVADSGERDRFTTRLERINGMTEVHISHERMEETKMDRDGTTFKWLPAKEDPDLNAVMLARLMTFLGADKEQAIEQAKNVVEQPTRSSPVSFDGTQHRLISTMDATNTWRHVGDAVSSAGFTIQKSDANTGTYDVLYLDTDNGMKRKEGNIFSRLWGDDGNMKPTPYTIKVDSQGSGSIISVYDSNGQLDQSGTGTRILEVISERF